MFSFITHERTYPMSGILELYIHLYGAVIIDYSVVSCFMLRILLSKQVNMFNIILYFISYHTI